MEKAANLLTNTETMKKASRAETTRSLVKSVIVNGALPFIIYWLLTSPIHTSEYIAVVASGIPSMIDGIAGVIRSRRIDLLAGITLSGIVVSLILIGLGGSPKIYLIRESFFTVALALAYLVSMFFPRPLGFYFARFFATGNHPENIAWFNSLWQHPGFRRVMRITTVVWGIGFLFEAAIRTYLVIVLSIPQFLIISPFVFYGFLAGILTWTFWYSARSRKRSAELERMAAEQA